MTKPDDLNAYIFSAQPHQLSGNLLAWMEASTRFTAFVEVYRDKICKKIRTTQDAGSNLDLLGELEVAYRLLTDRRFSVDYEPYASAKHRGPDFGVHYRVNLTFNLEVTRFRAEEGAANLADPDKMKAHILRILLSKLSQMQPGMPNVLAIHTPPLVAATLQLGPLLQVLKNLVEHKDPTFLLLSGFSSPVAFYKEFNRMAAILLWSPEMPLWVNKQARPGMDEKVLRVIQAIGIG